MLSKMRIVRGALSISMLLAVQSLALAQANFYGAPPPGDYSQGLGGNETGEPTAQGLGLFSKLPFKMNFALREGYDSNVFTDNSNPKSSFYTNFGAGLQYNFGSPRLQLSANLGGGVTWYYTRPGDKIDLNGLFALNAVYRATPRLTLTLGTSTSYLSQPDNTIAGGTNRQNGDYLYSNTSFSASYQWTDRFSTVTGYNLTAFYYIDSGLNDDLGHIEQTISQSFQWLLWPKTTIVAEYRANPNTYYVADLNSFNNFALIGFDQIFTPRSSWHVRVGAQANFLHNPVDGDSTYIGPYAESNLVYQLTPYSNIAWTLRYGTEASGLVDVTQRQTFRTGIALRYGFTPKLAATFSTNWLINYYDQAQVLTTSFYENIVDFSLGLNYKFNDHISLEVGYQFTIDVAPSDPGREYNRSVAFVGANFGF